MKLTEKVMMILFIALISFIAIDICSEIKKQDANELSVGNESVAETIHTNINAEDITMGLSSTEVLTTEATTTEAPTTEETTEEEPMPTKAELEMEIVYQHPELPTGCESVALTILLKYYGFDIEKTTIASDYLVYSDNFVLGYSGSPFTYEGAGIFAPGLVKTANLFLKDNNKLLNAKNITGSTPMELYEYVAEGTPVVVWTTIHMYNNSPTGEYRTYKGKDYQWDSCEHCVVLSGYDLERNIVIVHDPADGIIERDADAFWERYENLGSMAMIIR